MASPFVQVSKIDSELGQESLERLQRSIEHADVEMIESHGNVQYKNRSLDNLVLPLLRSLKLQAIQHGK
ncbi:hypothetical protein PRK78_002320 [Emydomyces testavorans]|uniref:Uncharacterized protein n=1 Tax=Emydomyces testavorans TaxID=2070801 RepID=A0AAF0DE59_9EURO|nr:hypothetical protein PRK78_002320 [Emydomyces testavorans]